ncbi:Amino acid transporter, partial [Operophtera brumata]
MVYFSISEADYITDRPSWKSFHGLARFSGVCFFSIDGVGVTLTVENNMRTPKYFSVVLQYGKYFSVVLQYGKYFSVVLQYVRNSPVRYSPQQSGALQSGTVRVPVILQFLIAIAIGVLFAVHLWVPSNIAWHYIGRNCVRNAGLLERMFRMVHVLLITCMA